MFKVDVLTPSSVLFQNVEAQSLIVPTVNGQINVLPEHTHVVSQLDTGIMEMKTANGVERIHLTTGICKVLKDRVTIMSRVAEKAEDIELARAENALKKAESRLKGGEEYTDEESIKYQRKMARAQLRIQLSKNFKK